MRVVVAQWLEHWWLNPAALGSIPGDNQDSFTFFLCFFPDPFRWESFNLIIIIGCIYIMEVNSLLE